MGQAICYLGDDDLGGAAAYLAAVMLHAGLAFEHVPSTQSFPAELLARLHEIEAQFGRARTVPNGPRTLDLDIIDLNGIIRAVPDPVLPHPRAHLRAFVLRPLLDVAPAWRHPTLRQSVTTLLAELPIQPLRPWHDDTA